MTKWLVAVIAGVCATALSAAEIEILNRDSQGEGLNDPAPREPVGGNDGETLGEQRLNALEFVADVVGSRIESDISIRVAVRFDSMGCDGIGGVPLASAGASVLIADFPNAPRSDVFYPVALANALAKTRLEGPNGPPSREIDATFNSDVDDEDCLPGNWYYGFESPDPEGNDLDFSSTATHEVVHGLGFQTFANLQTGEFERDSEGNQVPDIYAVFVRDLTFGENWPALSATERQASAVNDGNVVWAAPRTDAQEDSVTSEGASTLDGGTTMDGEGKERVLLYAPLPLEPGSSISHWDDSLAPDALMEPFLQDIVNVRQGIGLSACLLQDVGWTLINGTSCPDNNTQAVAGPAKSDGGGSSGGGSGGGGGGGCAFAGGTTDPLWPTLLLLALTGIAWRTRRRG